MYKAILIDRRTKKHRFLTDIENVDMIRQRQEQYDNIEYGFIADEVEKVNEDFVFYDIKDDGTKKLAGFEYNNMIAILTKAIQELNERLNKAGL